MSAGGALSPGVIAVVGAASALGAVLRYTLDRAVQRWTRAALLPWGTMTVNAIGSFVLGAVTGLAATGSVGSTTTAVLGAGLCGGLTTFSTWSYETMRLLEDGALRAAGLNVAASLAVGLALAGAGLALGKAL